MNLGIFLFLTILIVVNIIIGYVIASLLGVGPDLRTAIHSLKQRDLSFLRMPAKWLGFALSKLTFVTKFVKLKKQDSPLPQNVETTEEKLQRFSEIEVDELLEDEAESITRIAPIPELFDDNLMNIIFEQGTEVWMATDKHIETSIQKLNMIMMSSGRFAGELDEKLRTSNEHPTLDDIRTYCKNLADDCRNYIESQSKITEEIQTGVEKFSELKSLADEVEFANLDQASQIETTLSNLESLAASDDAPDSVERLIRELGNLRKARHNTRDIQDRVFLALARYENRMDSINRSTMFVEPITGLSNRIAFQTHLWEWWQQERQKKSKLTFVLYDIVGFNELNNNIGIMKCDRLLVALADFISQRVEGLDFMGMYSGNCLVSVSSNVGLRKTVAFAERIRQEIERTSFVFGDGQENVSLRLTCAVTEATDQQSETDLISVMNQTLAAAKAAGRDLTYMYDNTTLTAGPEQVEAPQLSIKEQVFDMKTMKTLDLDALEI